MEKIFLLFYPGLKIIDKQFTKIIVAGSWVNFSKNYYDKLNNNKYINYHYEFKNNSELRSDFNYLNNLRIKILKLVSIKLNEFHSMNESNRYWNIIIGFWLQNFLQTTFLNWKLINDIEKNYKLFSYYFYLSDKAIIAKDSFNFYRQISTNSWNANLISQILKYNKKTIFLAKVKLKINSDNKFVKKKNNIFLHLLSSINKNREVYLSNTYIGFLNELKVLSLHKQLPFFINDKIDESKLLSNVNRKNNFFNLAPSNDYEKFLQTIFVKNFPQSYLEHFEYYKKKSLDIYPKKTEVIVTGVDQVANDLYSIWVAENVKKGSKYVIIQHGEKGTYECDFNTNLETEISDFYLTWGWKNNYHNTKRFFFTKNFKKKNSSKKKVLLILQCFDNYLKRYKPNLIQDYNLLLFIKQIEFIELLNPQVKEQLIIRLPYPMSSLAAKDYYRKKILEIYPKVEFDDSLYIQDVFNRAKLVIFSYLGTSYLESLYLDIPSLLIIDKKTCIPNRFSKYLFKKMRQSKLILEDNESAANLVNRIFNNPNKWFKNPERTKILNLFKENFCKKNSNVSLELSNFLKHIRQENIKNY